MENTTPEDQQNQTVFTPQVNDSQPPLDNIVNPAQPESTPPFFYIQDQDDDLDLHLPPADEQDDQIDQSSAFVLPFQNSAAMPTVSQMTAQGTQGSMGQQQPSSPTPRKTQRGPFQIVKLLLIGSVVLITIIGASLFVFAQSVPSPSQTQGGQTNRTVGITPVTTPPIRNTPQPKKTPIPQPTAKVSITPSPTQGTQTQGQSGTPGTGTTITTVLPSAQLLSDLGWTQANLSLADAFEALRTGSTFTDREMSYDYRNIGTPTNHSGTLTAATFLLTSGGKVRFNQYDKREINNDFYNQISTGKMLQQVVDAHPALIRFQVVQIQGQPHKFAWVNVYFKLFQSKIDPASGKRVEQLERDPIKGQPFIHTMTVVLVRQSPQSQGPNAPMGGTGWLVNTYALDANGLPSIATDPSL